MNNGKTIFSQIMSNIPEREFKACVDRYKGNYRSRNFTCKDQFLVMSYAQLTNRGSLRDIENCLTALSSRLYHCGISYAVPRNTLAKANGKRDWRIYADFAQVLVKKVRPLYAKDDFRLDLDNMVYAFDSSTISLCLNLCPWAKFRKHKGGIKMLLPKMSIDFSQTTWSTKRLQSQNFIGKDGMWSFSSNGSSNTCTSNPSMEHLRMLSISRFGLPFVHTFYWL